MSGKQTLDNRKLFKSRNYYLLVIKMEKENGEPRIEKFISFHTYTHGYTGLTSLENWWEVVPGLFGALPHAEELHEVGSWCLYSFPLAGRNTNYTVMGKTEKVVSFHRGQQALYRCAFALRTSDFLKYSPNLKSLFTKVPAYKSLYDEWERLCEEYRGLRLSLSELQEKVREKIKIDSIPINEVLSEGTDFRLPILEPYKRYDIHVKDEDEALEALKGLYKNVWVRALLNFVVGVDSLRFPQSRPDDKDIIYINWKGERRSRSRELKFSDKSLDVEEICKYLPNAERCAEDPYTFLANTDVRKIKEALIRVERDLGIIDASSVPQFQSTRLQSTVFTPRREEEVFWSYQSGGWVQKLKRLFRL
jgi:hypothetical protein